MKYALSTNWCNRRLESGEAIADAALALGFDELELGYHTTDAQVAGFRRRLSEIPVGSVHAFCPVPISAPMGYPELYQLASFDGEMRAMASFQVLKNVRFAADIGADTLVLHAGRVDCSGLFARFDKHRRERRGRRLTEVFKLTLDKIVPELEKLHVTLALENLPYVEGFPSPSELSAVAGDWVKGWLDTGHDFVLAAGREQLVGMHVNDSQGGDDHLAPGDGKIDFAAFRELAHSVRHVVLEPNAGVSEARLKAGLEHLKRFWS